MVAGNQTTLGKKVLLVGLLADQLSLIDIDLLVVIIPPEARRFTQIKVAFDRGSAAVDVG